MTDPIALAQALIRRPSVTPKDAGALAVLEDALKPLGFACHRPAFGQPGSERVENLFARIGTAAPVFSFAGHTDVVPPGDAKLWRHDPFGAVVHGGMLHGRGAADMKSAIAAFVAAAARRLAKGPLKGSIALLITGDEEGEAVNGTRKVLDWMKARGETIDHCLVGEPSSIAAVGDTIKIGRRGSLNGRLRVEGAQGHAAFPAAAVNPIPAMAELVTRLSSLKLDGGTAHFEPSTLAFTSVDVGNPTVNVIPAEARAMFNVRFNDAHTPDSLVRRLETEAADVAKTANCTIALEHRLSAAPFVTEPGPFTDLIAEAAEAVTGRRPAFSTSGGTSDARFIKDHCPVAELGLVNATMHKVDECAAVADIAILTDIYAALLDLYFTHQ